MAIPTHAEFDALLRDRLASDPQLPTDPRAALSQLAGLDVPDFISITVHEESLTDGHIVIPAAPSDEFAEQDLEITTGGNAWCECLHLVLPRLTVLRP
jgi:hypothetical protein